MSRLKWLTALLVQHYEGFHPDLVALNRQPTNQRRVKREIYTGSTVETLPRFAPPHNFSLFFFVFFSILLACLIPQARAPTERETTLELPSNLESLINEESDRLDRPRTLTNYPERQTREKKRKKELQINRTIRIHSFHFRLSVSPFSHIRFFASFFFFFFSVSLDKSFRFGPEKVGFIVDSTLDSTSRPSSWWTDDGTEEREGAYGDILS